MTNKSTVITDNANTFVIQNVITANDEQSYYSTNIVISNGMIEYVE